jgi:hypothetical protein
MPAPRLMAASRKQLARTPRFGTTSRIPNACTRMGIAFCERGASARDTRRLLGLGRVARRDHVRRHAVPTRCNASNSFSSGTKSNWGSLQVPPQQRRSPGRPTDARPGGDVSKLINALDPRQGRSALGNRACCPADRSDAPRAPAKFAIAGYWQCLKMSAS